jgi:hypothetical protein
MPLSPNLVSQILGFLPKRFQQGTVAKQLSHCRHQQSQCKISPDAPQFPSTLIAAVNTTTYQTSTTTQTSKRHQDRSAPSTTRHRKPPAQPLQRLPRRESPARRHKAAARSLQSPPRHLARPVGKKEGWRHPAASTQILRLGPPCKRPSNGHHTSSR